MSKKSIVSIALTQVILDNANLKRATELKDAMVKALQTYAKMPYVFPDKQMVKFASYVEKKKFSIFVFGNFLLTRFDNLLRYTKNKQRKLAISELIDILASIIGYEDTDSEAADLEEAEYLNKYFEEIIN